MDLKSFRKNHKLSQSELAQLFGVTQAHVSSIEKGERNRLTPMQMRILVDEFGYDDISMYASPEELPERQAPLSPSVPTGILGDNNVQVGGNANNVNAGGALSMALAEIAKAHDLMSKMQSESDRRTAKMQEQMDRLISIIEGQQNK